MFRRAIFLTLIVTTCLLAAGCGSSGVQPGIPADPGPPVNPTPDMGPDTVPQRKA